MPLPELKTGIDLSPGILGGLQAKRFQQQNALADMEMQQLPEKLNILKQEQSRRDQEAQIKLMDAATQDGARMVAPLLDMSDEQASLIYPQVRQQYLSKYGFMEPHTPQQWDRPRMQQVVGYAISPEKRFEVANREPSYEAMPVQQDGQDTFALFNKKTGQMRPMGQGGGMGGGAYTPRPQKPAAEISMAGEKKFDQDWSAQLVKEYAGIDERAKASESLISNLQIARNIDIKTGALEPIKAKVAAVAEGFGIPADAIGLNSASTAQALTGTLQNVVLQKMIAQKGPQTENDAKRIEQTVANLGQTPEGFDFLLKSAIALEERNIEQRDFYARFKQETNTLEGANQAWEKFKRMTPLIAKNPNSKLPVFFNDFKSAMTQANPGITDDQIVAIWRTKYGGLKTKE